MVVVAAGGGRLDPDDLVDRLGLRDPLCATWVSRFFDLKNPERTSKNSLQIELHRVHNLDVINLLPAAR